MSSTEDSDRIADLVVESARRTGIGSGSTVAVGFSGGLDSTVLLCVLAAVQEALGIHVSAAYFDHGIRPDQERRREREMVRSNAGRFGLELFEESAAPGALVTAAGRSGESLEGTAREARYSFFRECAGREKLSYIALAHHLNDQVETLLMRALQGSGLHGMRGMAEHASLQDVSGELLNVWRPLLLVERAEIERYAAKHSLEYVEDSSNQELQPLRNRVRHHLMPALGTIHERGLQNIAATASKLAAADRSLDDAAYLYCGWRDEAYSIATDRTSFEAAPAEIRRRALYLGIRRIGVEPDRVPARFLNPLVRDSFSASEEGRFQGYGLYVAWDRKSVFLGRDVVLAAKRGYFVTIAVPPKRGTRYLRFVLIRRNSGQPIDSITLDSEALRFPLVLRTARAGDSLVDGGTHVVLRDLLAEHAIPNAERECVPVVEDRNGIAAVLLSPWGRSSIGGIPDQSVANQRSADYTFEFDWALGRNG